MTRKLSHTLTPASRDRISVDLRGLRAALFEQARARGVSPSDFVRGAVAERLKQADAVSVGDPEPDAVAPKQRDKQGTENQTSRVRLSLRLSRSDALALTAQARAAGLTPGAYVAGLVAGVPVLMGGASRTVHLAALVASSAELATLSRNLHRLTGLLRQGSIRAAQEYREMLDGVVQDVQEHLTLASTTLAGLRPNRAPTPSPRRSRASAA